jgi:hypothetical protein
MLHYAACLLKRSPLAGDARLLGQRLERAVNTLPDPIRRAPPNEPRSPVD